MMGYYYIYDVMLALITNISLDPLEHFCSVETFLLIKLLTAAKDAGIILRGRTLIQKLRISECKTRYLW